MLEKKNPNVLVVLTRKGIDRLLEEGGTGNWHLVRSKARQCDFVICTRNAKHPKVEGNEPHRSAFLIAKIKDVVPSLKEGRWLVQFSEYARLNVPDVWHKGNRNPVAYVELEKLNVDLAALNWVKMPDQTPTATRAMASKDRGLPLSIYDAKKGLSVTFGVPPDAIEITIRG